MRMLERMVVMIGDEEVEGEEPRPRDSFSSWVHPPLYHDRPRRLLTSNSDLTRPPRTGLLPASHPAILPCIPKYIHWTTARGSLQHVRSGPCPGFSFPMAVTCFWGRRTTDAVGVCQS